MIQLRPSAAERKLWGQRLSAFPRAIGTGEEDTDPSATDVRSDGSLWMMVTISKLELETAWPGSGISTVDMQSAWHKLGSHKRFMVSANGFKIKNGLFSSVIWAMSMPFVLDWDEVNVGWLSAEDIPAIFNVFERWLTGKVVPKLNIASVLRS